jgi:mannosyltransferase
VDPRTTAPLLSWRGEKALAPVRSAVLWALGGLVALGVAVRFSTLGIQSYHHDEIITVARVLPGGFLHMLRRVKESESNPPLYYVVAWAWSKAFGTGEVGMRSLSALLGAATVPIAFLAAREALSDRAGLIAAAIVAVNPMLIWYSQEARSYAMLVFFGALSLLFFLRCLHGGKSRDLLCWGLASAAALCSHYFAAFPVAIEAAWLLFALRSRWRAVLPAVGATALVGLALVPLLLAQINATHIGWIAGIPLPSRLFETGVSFLAGETGHVIAEPPRERYALIPAALVGAALALLALRGSREEWRAALAPLLVGLGVVLLAGLAALAGKDYVIERNLLPALVPLAVAVAVAFSTSRARRIGLACATLLCVYWLGFAIYVALTPNLQRPDFRGLTERLGPPHGPRAIVGWKLGATAIRFYLHDRSERVYGRIPLREIDVVSEPHAKGLSAAMPKAFQQVERVRLARLTLTRYSSKRVHEVPYYRLRDLPTGFGSNGVIADGLRSDQPPAGRKGEDSTQAEAAPGAQRRMRSD